MRQAKNKILKFVIVLTLTLFYSFCFFVGQVGATSIVTPNTDLLNWRYDPLPAARDNETFGNVWYDPVSEVWKMVVHAAAGTSAGTVVQYESSTPRGPWSSRQTALGHGTSGAWDGNETGVPFIWYEAGESRPWRMIYRGMNSSGTTQIGLATSVDGETWERKDVDGNSLLVSVTGATDNGEGLIRITAPNHGLTTGRTVSIYGVVGTTEANGNWYITVIDENTFDLEASAFSNAYVSDGTISFATLPVSGLKKAVTSFSNNGSGLVRVTATGHGYTTGTHITIWNAATTTEANGNWTVTKIDANTFDLQDSTFAHASSSQGYMAITAGLDETSNSDWGWDSSGFDFGGVLKYSGTYYLFYNPTGTPRQIGLATSTDLVHWTKDTRGPIFHAVSDYEDSTQSGTADSKSGLFCGDFVRWDEDDGTLRFVAIIPHYKNVGDSSTTPSYDVFTSTSPDFAVENRIYVGKAFRTDGTPETYYLEGSPLAASGADTPTVITDDITRNVGTSALTGNDVLLLAAVYGGGKWNQTYLVHSKTLDDAVLSNVIEDLPNSSPVFSLQPTGSDVNVIGLWLPGSTGTLREFSNYDYHLINYSGGVNSKGIVFNASNSNYCRYQPQTGGVARLAALDASYTLEARITIDEAWDSGNRTLLFYGINSGIGVKFAMNLVPQGSNQYKLQFEGTIDGTDRTTLSNAFTMLPDGTQYRLVIQKDGVHIKFFVDGVLSRAIDTYSGSLITPANAYFYVGYGGTYWPYFSGTIDEIRISDVARYTNDGYTPVAFSYIYESSGNIYTKVYDFGSSNSSPVSVTPTESTPTNTSISSYVRSAINSSDQSSSIGDFSAYPQVGITSQYQQLAFSFSTSDTSSTPTLTSVDVGSIPSAPTISTPSSPTSTSLRWTFSDNADDETGFKIYDNTDTLKSSSATTNLTYIDETGLSENTQYSGRYVTAYNSYGNSAQSSTASAIYTLAATPTNFTATPSSFTSADLSVDAFPNDTSGQSGYYFYLASDEENHNSGWIQENTWTDTSLPANFFCNSRAYYVKYRNGDGTETSAVSATATHQSCGGGGPAVSFQSSLPQQTQDNAQDQTKTQQQEQTQQTQTMTPGQIQAKIQEIRQQLIVLIIQVIQLLSEKVTGMK